VLRVLVVVAALSSPIAVAVGPAAVAQQQDPAAVSADQALVNRYCAGCHSTRTRAGNLVLAGVDVAAAGSHPEVWEKVVRKMRNGLMPPAGNPRPDEATYQQFLTKLQRDLDAAAAARPNPGRTEIVHRLNRLEYRNAVRDLLAVEVDVADLLPADDSSYGFDNIAGVLKMSPALVERYLAAARVISRTAVGTPPASPAAAIYRVSPELQQHDRDDRLPLGTRGGMLVRHQFPVDGEYEIKVDLSGAGGGPGGDRHQLEITVDGVQVALVAGAQDEPELRIPVTGGPHDIGVAFFRVPPDLVEQVREPFENPAAPSNTGGIAGRLPSVASVTIVGPHTASGPGDTPSRRRLFTCTPTAPSQQASCARTTMTTLARRAYRGLSTPEQVQELMTFYETARANGGGFDDGIELALRRLLVSPEFLYRIEGAASPQAVARRSPEGPGPKGEAQRGGNIRRISDYELASRLSFFLWSSIPDDTLLDLADRGALATPAVLERQVQRMLADPRAETLTTSFASQWLLIRNVATVRPGENYALNWDETLRRSMQRETELFIDSIVRDNRPATEMLTANYTFLNERLARHYQITNVQGSHFRRVMLPADSPRRGLLGHGSILTVTSPAIRTSPVIRGKWILNNILGAPPPDPPADVPALSEQRTQTKAPTMRERMAQHRNNPSCSACHTMIDPAGFALENFDATGKWRVVDESFNAIDASGALPDGRKFDGVAELRAALAARPERFVHTLTEKLLTYALGRGLEHYDMPAVRKILSDAAPGDYRMHAIVTGVVKSYPFQFRAGSD
jgi:mono/diheme cytochrome c family protein